MDTVFFGSILIILVLLGSLAWWSERRARLEAEALARRVGQTRAEMLTPSSLVDALATAIEDGLLVVEVDRRISFANEAASRLLHLPVSRIVGQTVMVALRDHRADEAVEHAFASGQRETITFDQRRGDRTLQLTCQSLPGTGYGAVVALHDITRLAHLERARREMVSNVSHELRTPLASMRLLVETLETGPPPEVARRMLGQIGDELAAMTLLVDELSELSQIESGHLALRLAPVAGADLAGRALERLRPQAERCGLTLHADLAPDLPSLLIDEERIGQVLLNLLHNALKWTPPGGTVVVALVVATRELDPRTASELQHVDGPGWIKVSVRDTGLGIPAGETERIFERFYKVDRSRARDRSGTGLGLSISKHLVMRHGGRIWAESREGEGTTVSMLLPAAGPVDLAAYTPPVAHAHDYTARDPTQRVEQG